ncbi:MAG: acyltransferase family protein, partial [Loigolactobacillus coryniformis]|uniref:acyltransferase family protein n=1 Tax=Loigolactobacillus coryniformis TaxID=1610 RepID=UPI002648EAC7
MKQRVYFMDCLNIVAIMAVILLHTSGTVFSYRMDNHWLLAVLMQVMFIWAVPIFFMLSGANLLNYSERYDTKTFFKKRWARVVVPFIFWSIVWY